MRALRVLHAPPAQARWRRPTLTAGRRLVRFRPAGGHAGDGVPEDAPNQTCVRRLDAIADVRFRFDVTRTHLLGSRRRARPAVGYSGLPARGPLSGTAACCTRCTSRGQGATGFASPLAGGWGAARVSQRAAHSRVGGRLANLKTKTAQIIRRLACWVRRWGICPSCQRGKVEHGGSRALLHP